MLYYSTLEAQGWALKRVEPSAVPAGAGGEAAPLELPIPAPPVETRETGYTAWPSLRPHFWLPVLRLSPELGTFVGAYTAGEDAVGRWFYGAQVAAAPGSGRAIGGLDLVYAGLGNPLVDVSVTQDWSLLQVGAGLPTVALREREVSLGAMVVRPRWYGFARARLALEYEHELLEITDSLGTRVRSSAFAGPAVLLSASRFVRPLLAVSAENGGSLALLVRRRERLDAAGWFSDSRGRGTLYWALPWRWGFAHHVLALRASAGVTGGPDAPRFGVGGVSSAAFALGLVGSLGARRDFPVRGWAPSSLGGTRVASASAEYRFPLALVGRGIGHLPLGVDRLSGVAFADLGGAWDRGSPADPAALRSVGGELVADLTVNYDFPVRVRMGLARRLGRYSDAGVQAYVTLGSDY